MAAITKAQGQVEGTAPIKILDQSANDVQSMKILAKNGLRPLTYQEALSRSSELIEKLDGFWFYLADTEIKKEARLYTFDKHGKLVEPNRKETPDQKVHVFPGDQRLSLHINSNAYINWRFDIVALYWPAHEVAPVVVGVEIDEDAPLTALLSIGAVAVPAEQFNMAHDEVKKLKEAGVNQEDIKALSKVFRVEG